MPLNLSFTHIMVVLVVALIVLGPDKLPEAARSVARWIGEFRRMSAGLQAEVRDTFGDFAEPFSDLVQTVRGGVTDAPGQPAPAAPGPPGPDGAPPTRLAELPSLAPSAGPVSPGPPGNGTAAPLAALRPLGPPEPAPGTFAPFPGRGGPEPAAAATNGHDGQSAEVAGAEPTG